MIGITKIQHIQSFVKKFLKGIVDVVNGLSAVQLDVYTFTILELGQNILIYVI